MDWFSANISETLVILGLLLLGVEILVLGFATFVLFFIGLAAIITGGLMWLGVVPETYLSGLLAVAVFSVIDGLLLWKPLKNMQKNVDNTPATSDLIGHQFMLSEAVSATINPDYKFSGITWKLTSNTDLAAGTKVKVTRVSVGQMEVEAVD